MNKKQRGESASSSRKRKEKWKKRDEPINDDSSKVVLVSSLSLSIDTVLVLPKPHQESQLSELKGNERSENSSSKLTVVPTSD